LQNVYAQIAVVSSLEGFLGGYIFGKISHACFIFFPVCGCSCSQTLTTISFSNVQLLLSFVSSFVLAAKKKNKLNVAHISAGVTRHFGCTVE